MSEQKKQWSLSIGTYPGILFGMRSYEEEGQTTEREGRGRRRV